MVLRRVSPPGHPQANQCDDHEADAKPPPQHINDYQPQTCHGQQTIDPSPMAKAQSQAAAGKKRLGITPPALELVKIEAEESWG